MKLIFSILFLSVCALGAAQAPLSMAQMFGPKTGFAGMQPGKFFQSIVLQTEAQKLLDNPDLTEDYRLRVLGSMANAEQGFSGCSSPGMMPWLEIRCSAFQLARSKKELKAIENELTAKAAAAAATAASNTSENAAKENTAN